MVDKTFNEECMNIHNQLRKLHDTDPLEFDSGLTKDAQKWAEQMAEKDKLFHSDISNHYGENIVNAAYPMTAESTVLLWYGEVKDYDFESDKQNYGKIGHFSQIVWKSSTKAGFGSAKSKTGKWYGCGRYSPAGNMMKLFNKNVAKYNSDWNDHPLIKTMKENEKNKASGKPVIISAAPGQKKVIKMKKSTKREGGMLVEEIVETYIDDTGAEVTETRTTSKPVSDSEFQSNMYSETIIKSNQVMKSKTYIN